ncbi:NAD-dependent epimerase [Gammaproteobacteria bacterium]|nr:NAD-dependent epimerase [Gammaproteobacteria bacterium]MDC0129004.1 NAD-dependent epimerase [Gammaproteobacteria bacterium]
MKILITGIAGFIGSHLAKKLISQGHQIWGLDNINDYYDPVLKNDRLKNIGLEDFIFSKIDLGDPDKINKLFEDFKPEAVVHLAAQAGVRYSLTNPHAYIDSNITGFLNILEASKKNSPDHLIYASSSSVYGINQKMPFSVEDNVDHPKSLYAASKKANELMAHTYSELFSIPTTGLRFFTVYGPWGRPDMALFIFTKSILEGAEIDLYNFGKMKRDFTYIDDIVEGIVRLIPKPPSVDKQLSNSNFSAASSSCPYQIFNIGNNNPVYLEDFVSMIEKAAGVKAIKKYKPLQPGDVVETYADIDALKNYIGFSPETSVEIGVNNFVEWYKDYYKVVN